MAVASSHRGMWRKLVCSFDTAITQLPSVLVSNLTSVRFEHVFPLWHPYLQKRHSKYYQKTEGFGEISHIKLESVSFPAKWQNGECSAGKLTK